MNEDQLLEMVKHNLGLSLDSRDTYLSHIIKSTKAEAKNSGIDPEGKSDSYKTEYEAYIIDMAAWNYRNRGGESELPRRLRSRRNNLILGGRNV